FEVFAPSQASSFVIPSTSLTSQVAGMTNAQAWTSAGTAISGTPTPCTNSRTGIVGFVCPAGSLPSLPPAPTPPPPPLAAGPPAAPPAAEPRQRGNHQSAAAQHGKWDGDEHGHDRRHVHDQRPV